MELNGVEIFSGALDRAAQEAILDAVRKIVAQVPLFQPVTARGQKMSVRMTAAGDFGWVSDKRGYRYERCHPETGVAWPPIPQVILEIWSRFAGAEVRAPECCLINFYRDGARMGLHQDRDEADLTQPVVSVSLGDDGLFRVGGPHRGGPTQSIWLASGDVAVLTGVGRMAYHGVDRIRAGSSGLLRDGGRLNLTLRVVT